MTHPAGPIASRPVAGVLWMLVTGLFFVAVTAVVKHGAADLPAAEAAFLRYALGLVFLIPMIRPMLAARITPAHLRLAALRGMAHTLGVILWFYAMTRITVAEVTAMNYLSPVYITLGAALFLGERLQRRRIAAVMVAFLGAVLILRPGLREVTDGHLAMLATAILFAVSYLSAKRLSDDLSPAVVVGLLSLSVTLGLVPFAAAVWRTPTPAELGWMFLVAVFATAGHYTMTLAFRAAPVAVTQPATFLQLVWATLLGWLVFGEGIDIWVVLGGMVILASVSFIAIREAMLKGRARVAPPVAGPPDDQPSAQ